MLTHTDWYGSQSAHDRYHTGTHKLRSCRSIGLASFQESCASICRTQTRVCAKLVDFGDAVDLPTRPAFGFSLRADDATNTMPALENSPHDAG